MMIDYLIWIIPYCLACYGVAMIGGNRSIGFANSLLVSFFLTPIVGLIVVMNSKKPAKEEKTWQADQIPDGYPVEVRIEYSKLLADLREGEISEEEFESRKAALLSRN
jgi:hypothetical protein